MNAYFAGVDFVAAMLALARQIHPTLETAGRTGVRSRQTLLAILGAAQRHESRVAVLRELVRALRRRGEYAHAVEELTPISGDPIAVAPAAMATVATLLWPRLWRLFHSGAVEAYSLTPEAWDEILSVESDANTSSF
jgi:hypothetical protein